MTLVEDLKWRGLIKDISSPELEEKLNKGGLTFYIGTDPTADSLHVGHLSSFLISKRLKEAGHHPILLVGGGTGMIGDPRPTTERAMIITFLDSLETDIFYFERSTLNSEMPFATLGPGRLYKLSSITYTLLFFTAGIFSQPALAFTESVEIPLLAGIRITSG